MTRPVDPIATAALVSRHLDALQVPYTIGGPIASSFAGEPRATIDIDMVVALEERHVDDLVAAEQVFDEVPHLGGNLVHDAHTAVLMLEHGVRRMVTRDSDFHRFPFLDPVDAMG